MDETNGSSWETWIQGIGSKVIGSAADAKYSQPYDIQKLQLQQLGQYGFYAEGQPGAMRFGTMGGISSGTLLLLGAGLLAVMLLKD